MKKEDKLFVSAVIVAAGSGSRMNMKLNKQYVEISGKKVLARALQAFEDCEGINEIVLVVNEKDIFYCKDTIVDKYNMKKVKSIVAGGATRQESVYNGICSLDKADIVVIHDGARPFVSNKVIQDCIVAASVHEVSTCGVKVKDTIKSCDEKGFVSATLERDKLWSIQTPQCFKYDTIIKAHRKALQEGFTGTDDTVLCERMGLKTKIVCGDYNNIKITTREDLYFADAIVNCEEIDY